MTAGASSALPAGAGTTCCPFSCGRRIITAARARCMGPAANGGSSARACPGRSSTRCARPAAEIGIPEDRRFQSRRQRGLGLFRGQPAPRPALERGAAFLKPVLKRPNLHLVTGAHVERVLFEGRRAVGLALRPATAQPSRRGRAARSCWPPARSARRSFWKLSGVGAPDRLGASASPFVHALPGVGENLQDHLQLRPIFGVTGARTLNVDYQSPVSSARLMALDYALSPARAADHGAVAARHVRQVVARLRHANLEFHVQPLSLDRFGEPLHRFPAITISVCNLRPASRGSHPCRQRRSPRCAGRSSRIICRPTTTSVSPSTPIRLAPHAAAPALARYAPAGAQARRDLEPTTSSCRRRARSARRSSIPSGPRRWAAQDRVRGGR